MHQHPADTAIKLRPGGWQLDSPTDRPPNLGRKIQTQTCTALLVPSDGGLELRFRLWVERKVHTP